MSKAKINLNIISSKNDLQWINYTLGKIEKYYNIKIFISYAVH